MRPFGVWGILVNGERDDRYGGGNGVPGSGSFALSVWFAIAALAVVFAVVALVYGNPAREASIPPSRPVASGGGATLLRGTPASEPSSVATTSSGRSDMVGAQTQDADVATELAKVRIENAALRQTTELLRGQIDALSERLGKIEGRFSEMTGSIGAPSAPMLGTTNGLPSSTRNFDDLVPPDSSSQREAAYTQFGMELGAYSDLTTLKTAWSDLVRQYPALFEGLDGLATIRDRGGRTELLLIAGPFRNAAEAAERCGKAESSGLKCLPAFYLGQQLSMH
ncbi:hypothetical protein [Pleomorphomonas sp. JP5]|uniref:hypothetical protein n=1 Tax=Pleomorphomonas sp. JP5 TaxID=2942998 RepID=UPI0020449F56|nr:hypothetical protein [Pleomorphomonas sp. JP5]MCM5556058.1 hypothetical protein [Pleomorphomonas sp. JP5]